MARKMLGPRQRHTREHVIANLSVHHVEGFILEEGHTSQRFSSDYGYDLFVFTYDEQGYAEPDYVAFQLKASESLRNVRGDFVYDLGIRDYNLWLLERMPVILVLYDATRRQAWWLHVQGCFNEDESRRPRKGEKTIRVRVPSSQVLDRSAIATIRDLKRIGRQ